MEREIEKWVTIKGKRIPIYKDSGEPPKFDHHEDTMKSLRTWVDKFDKVSQHDRDVIESFIYWDNKTGRGPISSRLSRGISMSEADVNALKVGDDFSEKKLASWSTSVGMAQAHSKHNVSDKKPCPVVFRLHNGTSQAAKLTGAYAISGYSEGEAIMSSKAQFKIVDIKKPKDPTKGYTIVTVEEKHK